MKKIKNKVGRTYFVDDDEDKHIIDRLSNVPFQQRNLRFLRKCCPAKPIIVDAGMHIGENTIEYSTWAKKVYGFEPCRASYDLAVKNILYNQEHWSKDKYWWYLNSRGSLNMTGEITTFNVGLDRKEHNLSLIHI